MDLFFVNTDKGRQSAAEWIRRGIAVTTDSDQNRQALLRIQPGDGVLAYENRVGVIAFGEAQDLPLQEVRDSSLMVNPSERVEYHLPVRWLVDLRENPISHTDVRQFAGVQPVWPSQQVRQGKQWLLDRVGAGGAATLELQLHQRAMAQQEDVAAVLADTARPATTRLALTEARLGQGRFRADLVKEFGGRCAVSGLSLLPVLRASHILPWREADDQQRLDPCNGLLLEANLDALFDLALITFDDRGVLLVSKMVAPPQRQALSLTRNLAQPSAARAAYLGAHHARFHDLEERRKAADAAVT